MTLFRIVPARARSSRRPRLGADLRALKPRDHQPILDAIGRLPEHQRDALCSDLHVIASLGDKAGLRQIRSEARFLGVDLDDELQRQDSFVNKAFWTWLHHPAVFDGAARLRCRIWKADTGSGCSR